MSATDITIPAAAKTDADKRSYLYRCVEKLRLAHNAEKSEAVRAKYRLAQVAVFVEINKLRNTRDDDATAETFSANVISSGNEKLAAKTVTKWDASIDVGKLI